MAEDGGTIPVWGEGSAVRAYTYVDDMVEGTYRLMQSNPEDWQRGEGKRSNWEAQTSLGEGIATTYAWIEQQVRQKTDEGRMTGPFSPSSRGQRPVRRPSSAVHCHSPEGQDSVGKGFCAGTGEVRWRH